MLCGTLLLLNWITLRPAFLWSSAHSGSCVSLPLSQINGCFPPFRFHGQRKNCLGTVDAARSLPPKKPMQEKKKRAAEDPPTPTKRQEPNPQPKTTALPAHRRDRHRHAVSKKKPAPPPASPKSEGEIIDRNPSNKTKRSTDTCGRTCTKAPHVHSSRPTGRDKRPRNLQGGPTLQATPP